MEKFNDIRTRDDLADFLKIGRGSLTYILYKYRTENCYKTFQIAKKGGGFRQICAPFGTLKNIQKSLAAALGQYWEQCFSSNQVSHGFLKGKSIITNAEIHRNKRFVLNVDLENFFLSFHFGRVLGYFQKNRNFLLPYGVAVVIAQIACYKGALPQGAPSSPIITNFICQIFDRRLVELARKYRLCYTRYADDLTFSTNDHSFLEQQEAFLAELTDEVQKAGFSVNEKKTRLQFRDSRQTVTGLTVNKKVNAARDFSRMTRAMAHRLYTTGSFELDGKPQGIKTLEGRFAFIDQLDRYNNEREGKKCTPHNLNGREEQYRAFLFYRHLFSNEKPVIVTEGKTDARYLRAALKNLYEEYPALVQREPSGDFSFKVSFFSRSKPWQRLYGISADGADAMKNLYYHFVSNKNRPNYFSYFQSLTQTKPQNPVILLYDNETEGDRPLKKLLDEAKIKEKQREQFKADLYLCLVKGSNLFLATNPLVKGKKECAIESLFPQEVLEHKIENKSFSMDNDYDKAVFYGKDTFSKYILSSYEKIDFSGFRGLLDVLDTVVKLYQAG